MTPDIEASGLTKSYHTKLALTIDQIAVPRGSFVAVVGPNGSGKSTFLKIIAGLIKPSTGTISIRGQKPTSSPARRLVAYANDTPVLLADLSVEEQMQYVARLFGSPQPTPTAQQMSEGLNVEEILARLPSGLSKGERQKASLIIALSRPFEIAVADEPTSGLDSASKESLGALFTALIAENKTVFVATHDEVLAARADLTIDLTPEETQI